MARVLLTVGGEFHVHASDGLTGSNEVGLELVLFGLEHFVLLSLSLPRVVSSQAVPFDTLNAALLLLVLGLGALAWWQARLGFWEDLTP